MIRKPDLSVVLQDNPHPLLPSDCSYHGVFDLCIEALSDRERSGIERDTVTKKAEYARGGVPEYYTLHRDEALQGFFTRVRVVETSFADPCLTRRVKAEVFTYH